MSLERVRVAGKGPILTPDEIIEGLQRPGVVDYAIASDEAYLQRIRILTLWIDPEVKLKVEAEISELLQTVDDTYKEDTKYMSDEARYAQKAHLETKSR